MSETRILKYPVNGNGMVNLISCRISKILDIQLQGKELMCWVETKSINPKMSIKLFSVGTGWEVPSDLLQHSEYIATAQDAEGFVWHFYYEIAGYDDVE